MAAVGAAAEAAVAAAAAAAATSAAATSAAATAVATVSVRGRDGDYRKNKNKKRGRVDVLRLLVRGIFGSTLLLIVA